MTNPDLVTVLRRAYAMTAACILPLGVVLLYAGRREWALGLCFGTLVSLVNAAMLVWRIHRAADLPTGLARRIMNQGMGIRFALVMLASIVLITTYPSSIPGFALGLLFGLAMLVAVAARALLAAAASDRVTSSTIPTSPARAGFPLEGRRSASGPALLGARYHAGHGGSATDVPAVVATGSLSASSAVYPQGRTVL